MARRPLGPATLEAVNFEKVLFLPDAEPARPTLTLRLDLAEGFAVRSHPADRPEAAQVHATAQRAFQHPGPCLGQAGHPSVDISFSEIKFFNFGVPIFLMSRFYFRVQQSPPRIS